MAIEGHAIWSKVRRNAIRLKTSPRISRVHQEQANEGRSGFGMGGIWGEGGSVVGGLVGLGSGGSLAASCGWVRLC